MKTIKLHERLSNYLITRNSLNRVFNEVNSLEDDKIEIDFDKISFISRSCADEYLKLKSNCDKIIIEKNCLESVKIIFDLIEEQSSKQGHISNTRMVSASAPIVLL
ncbi:MAG TPA: hypothetical protein VJH95_03230 [Candidatus Nanoarchaeia archaeon]|nr:hypothetical protein [Candidatus Nanoarchaeia archaeon]